MARQGMAPDRGSQRASNSQRRGDGQFPPELVHGSGVPMFRDVRYLLVEFASAPNHRALINHLREFGLALEEGTAKETQRGRALETVNHTDRRFWVRSSDGRGLTAQQVTGLQAGTAEQFVPRWIAPVYRLPNGEGLGALVSPLPNVLLIRSAPEAPAAELTGVMAGYGYEEDRVRSKFLSAFRYFVSLQPDATTAYELRSTLLRDHRGMILDARLENMPMVVPTTALPNDTLLANQWDMTQIRAAGPGTTGWDISTGAPGVAICVLDQGCDLTHPDLTFFGQGINLGTMGGTGAPTGNHGTACAGIAAARFNNSLGVAGVAGTCPILPVAFQNWTDAEVAAGINWAVANGAQVISMSFGHYAPGDGISPAGWDFTIIDPAINNAVVAQNCVLVAATGNEDISTFNRYPARHVNVIAVGASDQADNRKSPTSPDGETWWGSNWAPGVSVVAPGVLIPTTDRQGSAGYNNNAGVAGDYDMTFNGTSSATPHVAGLAALLRARNPAWSVAQIRQRIERTAAKVGTVAYAQQAGFANGTRNDAMGYGRIDVLAALQLVVKLKLVDDGGTIKWVDDHGTLKFREDPQKFKVLDDIRTVKFFDDGGTLKARDDIGSLKFADDPRLKTLDDGALKFRGDFAGDPGSIDPRPFAGPGAPAPRGAPFILATPHHSTAWMGSYPGAFEETLQQYEDALRTYEQTLAALDAGGSADPATAVALPYLREEYDALREEYEELIAASAMPSPGRGVSGNR
jgi:subtilisin family serine protease